MRSTTAALSVVTLATSVAAATAFAGPFVGRQPTRWESALAATLGTSYASPTMALKGLAKKAKEAEVSQDMEALRSSDPDSPVFKLLEQVGAGGTVGDNPERPLSSVLRKNKGTISVVAEYRKILKSGFIDGILAPELLCPLFRNGGASCVAVATEKKTGGCTDDDMKRVVKDQEGSRGEFPGPMPVIVRDLVLSEFQIARAKAAGASGVTIGLALVGQERTAELVAVCEKLGMEAVLQATSREEIEQAVAAGASVVSVVGKLVDEAIELRQHIPDLVVAVVQVDRRSDEGLDEIEDCWKLRDAGYNTVWLSEVLYKGGQMQAESAEAIVKAVRAKASVEFARARGMSGKGEGAKEYLGYLAQ
ncbi:unnamed protein product [Ascophyllum nodosum]